jgi:hypothetical protein
MTLLRFIVLLARVRLRRWWRAVRRWLFDNHPKSGET